MPTDGADFKRRVKYHGRTYAEIRNGSDVATVASFSVAGLAREILGDNPLLGFREMVLATMESLQGIFGRDRSCLLQELHARLNDIVSKGEPSEAARIVRESLIREAGRISSELPKADGDALTGRLLSATGQDLHEALVVEQSIDYAKHHRHLSDQERDGFLESWKDAAAPRLTDLMTSVFENGKPDKHFKRPRPELLPIRSDSVDDLNRSLVP